jgi:hypothetical protein
MSGIEITRDDLTASELRAASGKTKDVLASRRMLALALVVEGIDRKAAAQSCGMDHQMLRDRVHRYNADEAGLRGRTAALPLNGTTGACRNLDKAKGKA